MPMLRFFVRAGQKRYKSLADQRAEKDSSGETKHQIQIIPKCQKIIKQFDYRAALHPDFV